MDRAFIAAAKRGDYLTLRKLITSGADLQCHDSQGWTPLFHASARGDLGVIEMLLKGGADVNHGVETGFTALFAAVMSQHLRAVRLLLKAGAKVVPVQGIQLRGYAAHADEKKKQALIKALDDATQS